MHRLPVRYDKHPPHLHRLKTNRVQKKDTQRNNNNRMTVNVRLQDVDEKNVLRDEAKKTN